MPINLSIVAACLERVAQKMDNGESVQNALRIVASDLMIVHARDWGKPVPADIEEARNALDLLDR